MPKCAAPAADESVAAVDPAAVAVGVDVGGTKVAAGLVGGDGTVIARSRTGTPAQDADAVVELIATAWHDLAGSRDAPVPLGVGAPGIIDRAGVVRYAPNVALAGYPLRATLAERLGIPVTVANDANAAAWGEYRAGAGQAAAAEADQAVAAGPGLAAAADSLLLLTVGTGVGGGLVEGGRLVTGATGMGAEFGHIIVAEGGPACPCGNRGCLEAVASGSAIERMAAEAVAAGDVPASSALHRRGELTGERVTAAAEDGDATAVAVLATAGHWLGVGIATLVNALDPALVVIGGGAMQAGELLLAPARQAFHQRLFGRGHRNPPAVVPAQLAGDAGLVGAALLALGG